LNQLAVSGLTPQTREEQVALTAFPGYWAGKPELDSFVVHVFASRDRMIADFGKKELNAMAGLSEMPKNLASDSSVRQYQLPLTAGTYLFFKTSQGVLADGHVRQALIQGANTYDIVSNLGYPATPVDEPLLRAQTGYDATYKQAAYDPKAAAGTLDADGWQIGAGGIRYKNGQPLTFTIYAQDSPEYQKVTSELSSAWRSLGINAQIHLQSAADLQPTLQTHSYDALLYGISIGTDPDVFAYWDSSQADIRAAGRLNFSEWNDPAADASLEAGRTRIDPDLRTIKYQPLLLAWQQDAPALGLYQPRFLYITRGQVFGLREHTINAAADRYDDIQNWEIREVPTTER
jgi:peptide/nickel transport system substrate-binding protein